MTARNLTESDMKWKDIDLATWRLVFTAALYLAFAAGCQSQATVAETSESDAPSAAHVSNEDGTGSATEQETGTADQHQKSTTDASDRPEGIVDHAKQMFGQATDSGTQSAKQAGRWVSDQFRGAAGATQQITDDSLEWADATYQALKAQGLTTADSTSAWLVEDWNNMEAWTYQVETVEGLSDEGIFQW